MKFTCDRCHGDYEAAAGSTVAYLYLKDSRCNHIEAHCSHCGNREVIFLGPRQITVIIREAKVGTTVEPEATASLRVRAEKAWAAAEEKDGGEQPEPAPPTPSGQAAQATQASPSGDVLQRYELTRRHEELLGTFGRTLTNMPDELLWDELHGEHDRKHPDRWID